MQKVEMLLRIRCRRCDESSVVVHDNVDPSNQNDIDAFEARIDGDANYPAPCNCGAHHVWSELLINGQIVTETCWANTGKMRREIELGGGDPSEFPGFPDPMSN